MRLNSKQINSEIEAFLKQCQQSDNPHISASPTTKQHSYLDAGVLVLFQQAEHQQEPQWELVLTKKAEYLNKHAGQVAFPGGKFEDGDDSILSTALRETEEEVGVEAHLISPFHSLKPQMSRHNIKVYTFIAELDSGASHKPSCGEITHSFNVPIAHFINNDAVHQEVEAGLLAPCWEFQGFKIWGLTAGIIAMIIKQIFDVESIPIFDFRPIKI